ncbi:hypothetical protein IWW57_002168 [Coemansia sp. S610]|nr:hypothetical protein IWW57_002168 [Coemansia sp. S610]
MLPINDLPATVLAQILLTAVGTPAASLAEWKTNLPLVAVCRTWTALAQCHVFRRVFVELATPPRPHVNTRPYWTSNAELLISRRCVLAARHLTMALSDRVSPGCLQSIALDILKLDCVDWQHINTLVLPKATWALNRSAKPVSRHKRAVADIALTVQYFARNLRNIVVLDMSYLNQGSTGKYLYSNLVAFYGQKLQVLRAEGPIPFSAFCIARNIRVLELTLDSLAVCVLPSICGETLRVLKMENVPRNFAWHYFRYDIFVRPVVFRQLTVLRLAFKLEDKILTEDEELDKVSLGASNCDQLVFPALKQLAIENCPPDCDLLYASHPFPELQRVALSGSARSIRHCCRLKLTWVRDLDISMFSFDSSNTAEIHRVTSHFFAGICIGRTAALSILMNRFALNPDALRWINLTKLGVRTVDFYTACKAIGRLPNLANLSVNCLELDTALSAGFAIDMSLFESADPMLAWGGRLATLSIYDFSVGSPLAVCVRCIQALVLHAEALGRLNVPKSTMQPLSLFIDMYKGRHPHLSNITVS